MNSIDKCTQLISQFAEMESLFRTHSSVTVPLPQATTSHFSSACHLVCFFHVGHVLISIPIQHSSAIFVLTTCDICDCCSLRVTNTLLLKTGCLSLEMSHHKNSSQNFRSSAGSLDQKVNWMQEACCTNGL